MELCLVHCVSLCAAVGYVHVLEDCRTGVSAGSFVLSALLIIDL
jgi:hypothetical protein